MSTIKLNLQKIANLISDLLDNKNGEVDFNPSKTGIDADLVQRIGNHNFVIEYKPGGDVTAVARAIETLKRNIYKLSKNSIPVVAVPYMGDAGRIVCLKNRISWLDLSGNANISAPGLKIYIEGKPNKFKSAGRPKDIFAPKSSRITRHLLIEPKRYITQRELRNETNLDEGLISRVVREMEKIGLVVRESSGGVRPRDPNILLDAWNEKYSFSKHRIIKGSIAQRSSDAVVKSLIETFRINNVNYALTGLAAAWQLSHFATFRTSTVYLSEEPPDEFLNKINFIKGDKGSNVWLVIPNDDGVFDGALERRSVRSVHPVQIYLDLKGHPERAKEAADEIRKEYLTWNNYAE